MGSKIVSDEATAGAILEKVLGVINVKVVDTGKVPGSYDLELVRNGATYACVEVTSTVVEAVAEFRGALLKRGQTIKAPELSGTWCLSLRRGSKLRNFERRRADLIEVLRELEQSGVGEFSSLRNVRPTIDLLRRKFGVLHGCQLALGPNETTEILLGEAPDGGAFGVSKVVAAIERLAAKNDNIQKLSKCVHVERHFFVFIDADTGVGNRHAMELPDNGMAKMPNPPVLPEAIAETTIWAATWLRDSRYLVWRCQNGSPWESRGVPRENRSAAKL